jgi:hypothetical protein
MSPTRAPGFTAAMARRWHSNVVRSSRRASSGASPTAIVAALSPCIPSTIRVTSMPMMSPSRSTTSRLGMPWQITSLMEVQMLRGKPL